jgi:hypothetical protein
MGTPNNNHLTDTLNWDTVFAIPITEVNKAIVQRKSSPTSFDYTSDTGTTLRGSFGDWQVTSGGDGGLVWLAVPVANVTGTFSEFGDVAWAKGTLIIEVRLLRIPHVESAPADQPADASPTTRRIAFKVRAQSNDPDDPVVSLKQPDFLADPTGPAVENAGLDVIKSLLSGLLVDWLNQHLADFEHVFATVELNDFIDHTATWAWCKPTYTDYAYTDGLTPQTSIFGVLCMTGGRQGTAQQIQQIDPYVIPTGSIGGFLVSQQRLLEELMLPTLPMKWTRSTRDDYEVVVGSSEGSYEHILQLKAGRSVQLDDVVQNNAPYTPYLKTMKITMNNTELAFETYTETDVGSGVTAYCKTQHWYTIELGQNKQGQTLVYRETQKPVMLQGTIEQPGMEIVKWIEIIVGVVATVVLGVVTEGAGFAVGAVVIGLLVGAAIAEPEIVAAVNTDTSPSLDLLVLNATHPITWESSSVFNLNFAGLNGPLQLGGTPNFAEARGLEMEEE